MPSYQIRFVGQDCPDPESILGDDIAKTSRHALERLRGKPGCQAVILNDGFVVAILSSDQSSGAQGLKTLDQTFASAGIYRLGGWS